MVTDAKRLPDNQWSDSLELQPLFSASGCLEPAGVLFRGGHGEELEKANVSQTRIV